MEIKKGKIIELNNKEYFVIDDIVHLKEQYFYIASKEEHPEFLFLHCKDDTAYLVSDDELIKELLLLVAKNV